jgi:DNA-binding MarR family transcriptional regulator
LATQPILLKIKMIENLAYKYGDANLKKFQLTRSQADVIFFLSYQTNREINQRDIEKALSLSNPSVSGLLKRLEQKGFIKRHLNPIDTRSYIVELTEQAYEIVEIIYENVTQTEKILFKGFSDEEIITAQKLLNLIADNVIENM